MEVRPQVRQNMKQHSVALDFQVNKGAKIYFDRIIISGNTRTRDKVIRRELGVAEGDLFSATAIRSGQHAPAPAQLLRGHHHQPRQGRRSRAPWT